MRNESVSIIVATMGREKGLKNLFRSLTSLRGLAEIRPEIVVVNNADDGVPEETVGRLVEELRRDIADLVCLRHHAAPPRPKCIGHNLAIKNARGAVLAFVDDDVEVAPDWLAVVQKFFATSDYDAMQGAILVPPAFQNDRSFLKAWNRYRTIPYIDYGSHIKEISTLTGPNMAFRRQVFDDVGLFDERLGPGRSGMSEDVEFAQRMLRAGKRIAYEPAAAVYHEADWSRLNDAFFRRWHECQGQSRLIYKNQGMASIVPNLLRAALSYGWYSVLSRERKKYRALGRCYHYRAMLRQKLGRRSGSFSSSS